MTAVEMRLSHWMTPEYVHMAESAVTWPTVIWPVGALMVSWLAAVIVMPMEFIWMELPLLSDISMDGPASAMVNVWPPGVSRVRVTAPLVSSMVTLMPERDVMERMSLFWSIDSGGLSWPFHSAPIT